MTSELKVRTVRSYAEVFDLHVLVETGTCFGDLIFGVRDAFQSLYSIELSKELFDMASRRFADDSNVHLFHGDSAQILPTIMDQLPCQVLFWLDAHYSGGVTARGEIDTPVESELQTILACRSQSVILVDDADCFNGSHGYPTCSHLDWMCRQYGRLKGTIDVRNNIIRILPKG